MNEITRIEFNGGPLDGAVDTAEGLLNQHAGIPAKLTYLHHQAASADGHRPVTRLGRYALRKIVHGCATYEWLGQH